MKRREGKKRDDDFDAELRAHLAIDIQQRIDRGQPPEQARTDALRAIRSIDFVKESARDGWRGPLELLGSEMQRSVRTLLRAPGFCILAALTFALGIGGATAMFSIVNGVLLRPLQYRDPDRLVAVTAISEQATADPLSAYYFKQWKAEAGSLQDIAAIGFGNTLNLTGDGDPDRVGSERVTMNLFDMLGVQPQLGRSFSTEDGQKGTVPVTMISDGLWTRRFARDPAAIGRSILINGESHTIVGVMPANFRFPKNDELHRMIRLPEQIDIWRPLIFTPQETESYFSANYAAIGRLNPGASVASAEAELNSILQHSPGMLKSYSPRIRLNDLQSEMTGRARQGLLVLMAGVLVLLLIACVNIANLLLGRANTHRHEIAVRTALGASRFQIATIPCVETCLVAVAGAVLGILLAYWLVALVHTQRPAGLPRIDEITLDGRVLLFAVAATVLSAFTCSVFPASRLAGTSPGEILHATSATLTSNRYSSLIRSVLVAGQCALCVVLTIASGLLIHSFVAITGLDQGFKTDNVVSANLQLIGPRYNDPKVRQEFFANAIDRIRALPGVQAAGVVTILPLMGQTNIMGLTPEAKADLFSDGTQAEYRYATSGYFAAMGIPLIRGSLFEDRPDGPKTALISQATAQKLWPGQDPIGKRFMRRNRDEVFLVTGIVGDVRTAGPDRDLALLAYTPMAQQPLAGGTFVVRTTDPNIATALRSIVASIDKSVSIAKVGKLQDSVAGVFAPRRFQMLLLASFAATALILAAIGIYGVISASVISRRKEIGIRVALGADRGKIARLVLVEASKPVLCGITTGLLISIIATQVIQSLLFGVTPLDSASYGIGVLVLLGAALAGCWIPMRAATRVDPTISIRSE